LEASGTMPGDRHSLRMKGHSGRSTPVGPDLSGWDLREDNFALDFSFASPEKWPPDPTIVSGTGGSGTRVVARILMGAGVFMGGHVNDVGDAIPISLLCDLWANVFAAREKIFRGQEAPGLYPPMVRCLAAALKDHWGNEPPRRSWGWKAPRSMYLLPFFHSQLPHLRFVHLVRDGRDIALSQNQAQLNKHGLTYLSPKELRQRVSVRSIALWNRINLAAAEYGERELGDRYVRIRFEDLCAEPASVVGRLLDFVGLEADVETAARLIEQPSSIGRWRQEDPRVALKLERFGKEALEKFGYVNK
jgi:hypothetical protein